MTDQETISIHADVQGNVRVLTGAAPSRDGDIRIGHDVLAAGIRNSRPPPAGSYQVTFYTPNGRATFGQLKSAFAM